MKQKLIHTVVTDMLSYLNNAQVEKLKEVLLHTLWDYDISPSYGKDQGAGARPFSTFFLPQSVLRVVPKSR